MRTTVLITPPSSQRRLEVSTGSEMISGCAQAPQAFAVGDIFHQRYGIKTASFIEQGLLYKQHLVTRGNRGQARALVHKPLDNAKGKARGPLKRTRQKPHRGRFARRASSCAALMLGRLSACRKNRYSEDATCPPMFIW